MRLEVGLTRWTRATMWWLIVEANVGVRVHKLRNIAEFERQHLGDHGNMFSFWSVQLLCGEANDSFSLPVSWHDIHFSRPVRNVARKILVPGQDLSTDSCRMTSGVWDKVELYLAPHGYERRDIYIYLYFTYCSQLFYQVQSTTNMLDVVNLKIYMLSPNRFLFNTYILYYITYITERFETTVVRLNGDFVTDVDNTLTVNVVV